MVSLDSYRVSRARHYSGFNPRGISIPIRSFHALWPCFPAHSGSKYALMREVVCLLWSSFNPSNRNAKRLDTTLVWACPDSLATTTGILSFPQGTLDVSVPLVPSAFAVAFRLGCPIRRSRDHCLLATPPSFSQRCHVLLRHTTPRHPPYAHSVFPVGTSCTCLDTLCSCVCSCLLLFRYTAFLPCTFTSES